MSNLRAIPSVNDVLKADTVVALIGDIGRDAVVDWIRTELDAFRAAPDSLTEDKQTNSESVATRVVHRGRSQQSLKLGRVINATGVILHTGLGRAPVSNRAIAAAGELATAGNVEVCLKTGDRKYRGHQLQPMWQQLTGCEDSLIVNNNAAATLLTLQALCEGKEVVISRGQLIEIGGSFRLPEIFELGGAKLREVGTTNRTRVSDYADAIGPNTAAIMHVHPSNYRVVGFTSTPRIEDLVPVAKEHGVIAIDDIGSGSLVDVRRYGLPEEPTFKDSIAAGADVVLGSGDKLLGGPQAGIIIGSSKYIEPIRKSPFARTVRVDKLTLAALSATLGSYVREQHELEIPTLRMMSTSLDELKARANTFVSGLSPYCAAEIVDCMTPVGGGSLPGAEMPSVAIAITVESASKTALRLRMGEPRVFPRIQDGQVMLDLRSVLEEDLEELQAAVIAAMQATSA